MKDSGCAFKVVDAGGVRYYTSPEVLGLADFARSLHENERDGDGSPLPLAGRIAGAVECPEAVWWRGWPWRTIWRRRRSSPAS